MPAEIEITESPELGELALVAVQPEMVVLGEEIVESMRQHHRFTNRTGKLEASFGFELDAAGVLIVGSTEFYARFLELGTSRMAAQPFLLPALMDHASL